MKNFFFLLFSLVLPHVAVAEGAIPVGALGDNITFQKPDGSRFEIESHPQNDEAIRALFNDQTLYYKDGSWQVFHKHGATDYFNPEQSLGKWRIDGKRYCSSWPPSESWICYDLLIRSDGVVFISGPDSETIGFFDQNIAEWAAKNDYEPE